MVDSNNSVFIIFDECVECGNCLRSANCPTNAIYQQKLDYPRSIRKILSDPLVPDPITGVYGRGTEEIKTNDIRNNIKEGWIGMAVELGRPITGTRFRDAEKVTKAIAKHSVKYEEANPVTPMIMDKKTGEFKKEIINEKVISAILEFLIEPSKLIPVLESLEEVSKKVDCVFCIDIASRCDTDSISLHEKLLKDTKYENYIFPNGKYNLGLGKI